MALKDFFKSLFPGKESTGRLAPGAAINLPGKPREEAPLTNDKASDLASALNEAKEFYKKQDYDASFRIFSRYADHPSIDAESLVCLGYMHLYGQATSVNPDRGLALLKQSAALGEAAAMYSIGCIYWRGTEYIVN